MSKRNGNAAIRCSKQIHKLAHSFNLASQQTLRMMRDLHLVRRSHDGYQFSRLYFHSRRYNR
ncbi:MAG: hypothetical protein FCKEOINB_01418 [Nitrosomonas sp.]|nr:hypothetical protein [Nitrosomonas sp.]